jgi:hypothetical protein
MKKAFFQLLILLVFANGSCMLSLAKSNIPLGHELEKAVIIYKYYHSFENTWRYLLVLIYFTPHTVI